MLRCARGTEGRGLGTGSGGGGGSQGDGPALATGDGGGEGLDLQRVVLLLLEYVHPGDLKLLNLLWCGRVYRVLLDQGVLGSMGLLGL